MTYDDPLYLPIDLVPPLRRLSQPRVDSSVSFPYVLSSCTRKGLVIVYTSCKLLLDPRGYCRRSVDTLLCERDGFAMSDALRAGRRRKYDGLDRSTTRTTGWEI